MHQKHSSVALDVVRLVSACVPLQPALGVGSMHGKHEEYIDYALAAVQAPMTAITGYLSASPIHHFSAARLTTYQDCLQIYDRLVADVGPLHTCLAVPPLLAAFYVVLGSMQIAADWATADSRATQAAQARATWPVVALNTGCAAASCCVASCHWSSSAQQSAIRRGVSVVRATCHLVHRHILASV